MKSVVLVDDNIDILELLKHFCTKFDKKLHIKTFDRPLMALNYIQNNKVDLVVSDITMPGLDGISLLQKVKEKKDAPYMMMISAESSLDRVLKSHKYDADDYLHKPIDFDYLKKSLERYLA